MSLSYTTLKPVKVVDPRVNISEAKNYLFKQGSNVVTHRTYTATSSNTSSTTFKCNPPNPNIVVGRLVYVTIRATFAIRASRAANNGVDFDDVDLSELVGGNTANNNAICPRQFPLASVMKSLKVNINSDTLTVQPYHYIHALGRYHLDEELRAYEMSSSPSQPDEYQKYADRMNLSEYTQSGGAGQNPVIAGSLGLNYGTQRSPFAQYGETGYEIPRASYKTVAPPVYDGAGTTTFTYEFTEPLFISPLSGSAYNVMGLAQVSTMDVEISWDTATLSRMLSIDKASINTIAAGGGNKANGRQIDNITVTIDDTASQKISFIYMTPQINRPRPESLIYDFHELYVYQRSIGNVAAGAVVNTVQSDNMSLSSIPSRVYIFARQREGDRNHYTSDTFPRISKIDINFNGVSGILSSANEWELWRMASDNGLRMSYNQWKFYTGSVLCIDFGKNVGLGANQCVGMLGTYDFSYQLVIQNIDTVAKNFDLYTVIDSAGTFSISNNQIVKQIGVVSSSDVLEAEDYKEMDMDYLEKLYGGNFMSGLKNVYHRAQKLKPYAKKGIKLAKQLEPVIDTFAPRAGPALNKAISIADMLVGQGYSKADINKMRRQGYTDKDFKKILNGGNVVGGGAVGGRGLPKSKLQKRLESYR